MRASRHSKRSSTTPQAEDLPYIDRHCIEIGATREELWAALEAVLAGASKRVGGTPFASVLGLRYRRMAGPPLEVGSTIVGFCVAKSEPGSRLVLSGEHRFSRYTLTFELNSHELCGVTHAVFPGPHGAAYKALLLGARAHVLAMKRLMRAIKKQAENPAQDPRPERPSG